MDNSSFLVIIFLVLICIGAVLFLTFQLLSLKRSLHDNSTKNMKDQLQFNAEFYEHLNDQLFQANQQQYQLFDGFQKQISGLKYDTIAQIDIFRNQLKDGLNNLELKTGNHLEKIQFLVDDKLHKTLDQRLGQSFQLVNESLLKVQSGLGEMQSIAAGVGDLKKVLSNVKTRGILGEIQLGNILEEVLTKEQYSINVATIPNSRNHVEFAIKFPGGADDQFIWLPIDAKFPLEIYERLLTAFDDGNLSEIENAKKILYQTVKKMAADIKNKYIQPPFTTDFAVLFLPIEGLYAEVVRDPEMLTYLQRHLKIMIAGPSNLAAFLNSMSIGFRTLAIEKRTSEVWTLLETIKGEFSIFSEILGKTQKKLLEASNVIAKAKGKSSTIHKKLVKMDYLKES